jgi:hypothetical protein
MNERKYVGVAAVLFLLTLSTACTGPQGSPGPAGPPGSAGSARAYARWALGSGLVAAQTKNFTSVSSPSDGVYCLTPATGIDPATTVAFGAYAADGVPANNAGRPPFVDIVYGQHDCPAGQYEIVTGTPNPNGTINIHQLNGFAVVVP